MMRPFWTCVFSSRWLQMRPTTIVFDLASKLCPNEVKSVVTCLISFSISPARITSGPRTAYSILITFGFIESNVNCLVDDMARFVWNLADDGVRFSWVVADDDDDDNKCSMFAVKMLYWRLLLFARRRQFLWPLPANTVFKHRLLIIVGLYVDFFPLQRSFVSFFSRVFDVDIPSFRSHLHTHRHRHSCVVFGYCDSDTYWCVLFIRGSSEYR